VITAYLVLLIIAPQDWFGPLLGLPVDYILYPLWAAVLLLTGRSKYLFRITWQDGLLAAFVGWLYVSSIANFARGIDGQHLYMYAKWLVLYKLVAASLPSLDHLRRTAGVFLALAFVLVVESLQHFHSASQLGWAGQPLGWIDPAAIEAGIPGRTQWVSIFDGPGVFCVVFTVALPFLLQHVSAPYGFIRRAFAAALLLPLGLAIYYTGSRGGFLATLAVLALHFGLRIRSASVKFAVIGSIVSAFFVAAPAYLTSIYDANRSAQHRVDMWIDGLDMVRYYPVFGVGRGHFADYTGSLIAHNSVIEIAGETGLPGVILWSAAIFMAFKTLWAFVASTDDDQSAMFVTLEYETLYFLLAMTAAVGHQVEPTPGFARRDAVLIVSAVGTFFVLLRVFVALYY
jgi:O-antigen ligase